MAWQADTVYQQQRPIRFGTWPDHLKKVNANVVFSWYGQNEALDGLERIPQFVTASDALLDTFAQHADRIVVVSPIPFEKTPPPLRDLSAHNKDLKRYVDALRDLATRRGHAFVDLSTPQGTADDDLRLTENGMHLKHDAFPSQAVRTARQLGVPVRPWNELEPLRAAIVRKNRLWFDYWRPMNWSFLHGTRTMVPFSLDAKHKRRTFPEEMEKFLPIIASTEAEIAGLASQPKP